jgi:hypothetical protein
MDKVVRQIVKALSKQGFDVVETKSGRLEVVNREGDWIATIPSRFKAGSGLDNALAPLRRAGFRWPPS